MSEYCLDALRTVEAVDSGEMSPREAIDLSLSNIARLNPRIGAFLVAGDPGDREFDGPLGGLPYAVKDNLCTRGMPTTCASQILEGYTPPYDAHVVSRMRGAGAALVGKTNMDEFAMGSSNENSHFGPVRNPWDLSRVPGGSSGGSAAAVAAGMVPVALGSDTGGSIRQPSAFCGVTGMKPTYGAVSRRGLIAFASSMDQIGPIARSARDCALALDVLVSRDSKDSTSVEHPEAGGFLGQVRDGKDGLDGVRIGLPGEYYAEGIDPGVAEIARQTARTMEEMGAMVEEMSLPHTEYALPTYYVMASAEASSNLSRYDGIRYGLREIGDGIEELYRNTRTSGFGDEVKRRIMLGSYALSAGYYDAFYLKAARVRRVMAEEIFAAFQMYDYLLTPTTPTTAFEIGDRIEDPVAMYMADICTIPANLAGIPAVSFPGGFVDGLPAGVQLMGPRFSDAGLLMTADVFQRTSEYHLHHPSMEEGDET